jgi:hypothetical protein
MNDPNHNAREKSRMESEVSRNKIHNCEVECSVPVR